MWLKLARTAFVSVLVPVYWRSYGRSNVLYLCDIALLLALLSIWAESTLVGIAVARGDLGGRECSVTLFAEAA